MPDVRVHESFLEAMAEFRGEGRGDPVDDTMIGAEMREFSSSWSTPEGFAAFVAALRAQAAGEHLPAGFVPCTTLWWAEDHEHLGRIAIVYWSPVTSAKRDAAGVPSGRLMATLGASRP